MNKCINYGQISKLVPRSIRVFVASIIVLDLSKFTQILEFYEFR